MAQDRKSIIASVQTPLGLFALVVLVGEAILVAIAVRATGNDVTILILGILIVLFSVVVAVGLMARGKPHEASKNGDWNRKYDVFLSSVLAGFGNDARLLGEKNVAMQIVRCLEQECKFSIYYAGREVSSAKDFDHSHIGARKDLQALRDSKYFLMLYPERVTSSVLFEAGFALDHCKSSIYLVRNKDDLPYLMRRLPEIYPSLRTFTFTEPKEILDMIKTHREDLFRPEDSTS